MEVVGCRTSKINTVLLLLWLFLFPNVFMASTFVNKQMQHSNVEVVGCRTSKINIVFTVAVAVLVPKYIYGLVPL